MASIKWEGNEVELAEDWRLGEQEEAENALDIDLETARSSARMQLILYISIRRQKPETELARFALADLVKSMDISAIAAAGESGPLDSGAGLNGSGTGSEDAEQLTTGSLPTDTSSQ